MNLDEQAGDDISLSDLSISEPDLESEDVGEMPALEPSSWTEVGRSAGTRKSFL